MRRVLKTASLLTAVALIPMAAQAAILAENHDTGVAWQQPFYNDYVIGQTFKATFTGTVTDVVAPLHVYYNWETGGNATNPAEIPVTFGIYNVVDSGMNGLQRTGAPISTGTITWTNPGISNMFITWIDVPMTPATLDTGTTYMLVATSLGTNSVYTWYAGNQPYPDGNLAVGYSTDTVLAQQPSYDLPFQVVGVPVPEPASLALLLLPASMLARRRQHA